MTWKENASRPADKSLHCHMKKSLFRKEITSVKTLVVKVGSRILTTQDHQKRVSNLVDDMILLHKAGVRLILVSSGAIAHGMKVLGLEKRPSTIPLQQACAAIGQNRLMQVYQDYFSQHKIPIGQVLLTWDDLRSKKRYFNLRNTMFQLLECGAIPIINENDSVGVEEIQFGNNDILGAQVALLVQADVFVNLTDVGGLYDRNPHADKSAVHIPVVSQMSSSVHKMAGDLKNELSVGGMATKLKAAEIVTRAGMFSLIGDGFDQRLTDVLTNDKCATLFIPSDHRMSSRQRWIAFTGQSSGVIFVDEGAGKAIVEKGKSLLPAGIIEIKGNFKAGDKVEIRTRDGKLIAGGLANYSAEEVKSIKGCRSSEIAARLGRKSFDEVIHRDNLAVL
mgnify:CR=1 FL=1